MRAYDAREITNKVLEKELKDLFEMIKKEAETGGICVETELEPYQARFLEHLGYKLSVRRVDQGLSKSLYRIFW